MDELTLNRIALLADHFVAWQNAYGRPDPKLCPFVYTDTLVTSCNMHSPTFMAIGLYEAFKLTGRIQWKEAADRYVSYYLAVLRDPQDDKHDFYGLKWYEYWVKNHGPHPYLENWSKHILTWPFIYGMALAAYRKFKEFNPGEMAFDSKASAIYEWLQYWRWDEGSYFRNGYSDMKYNVRDAGNSDDNCHIGRGLTGYYAVTKRDDVLRDAEGLARYYTAEAKLDCYDGCWSSEKGTWIIAPTRVDSFEHFSGKSSFDLAWCFSAFGAIDYLTELAAYTRDEDLKLELKEKCASAMAWMFDECQFDDGALGMGCRDDKWIGTTAGAITAYVQCAEAGFLDADQLAQYGENAKMARQWLLENLNKKSIDEGGYFKVTGKSEARPPDNLAWLFGITLNGLTRLDRLSSFPAQTNFEKGGQQ